MQDIATADPRAKAQLDLLAHLIGSRDSSKPPAQMEIRLSLFNDNPDDEEEEPGFADSFIFSMFTAQFSVIDAQRLYISSKLLSFLSHIKCFQPFMALNGLFCADVP